MNDDGTVYGAPETNATDTFYLLGKWQASQYEEQTAKPRDACEALRYQKYEFYQERRHWFEGGDNLSRAP